jgi:hypothetical protein
MLAIPKLGRRSVSDRLQTGITLDEAGPSSMVIIHIMLVNSYVETVGVDQFMEDK